MKWALVGAGVKDLGRPAEKLSVSQNLGQSEYLRFRFHKRLNLWYSSCCHWIHLGEVLVCHYPSQLQSGRRELGLCHSS